MTENMKFQNIIKCSTPNIPSELGNAKVWPYIKIWINSGLPIFVGSLGGGIGTKLPILQHYLYTVEILGKGPFYNSEY